MHTGTVSFKVKVQRTDVDQSLQLATGTSHRMTGRVADPSDDADQTVFDVDMSSANRLPGVPNMDVVVVSGLVLSVQDGPKGNGGLVPGVLVTGSITYTQNSELEGVIFILPYAPQYP